MISREVIVLAGALACFIGCFGDFLSLFILGSKYPGYRQISDPVSFLGSSGSPVSKLISVLWVILGGLIIIFALGFRAAYSPVDRYANIAFWLLVIYGLGEGLGSGLFKADIVGKSYSLSFIIHNIVGGAGVGAALVLMLVVPRIEDFSGNNGFLIFSRIVLFSGVLLLFLFSQRFIGNRIGFSNQMTRFTGLWQRLLMLDFYIFFLAIAWKMVQKMF